MDHRVPAKAAAPSRPPARSGSGSASGSRLAQFRATPPPPVFGSSISGFGGGSSGFGGGSSGGMGGGGGLGDPTISSAPESVLVGRTLLVADNITNSIVAQGPPPALEIIESLLDQIDVKPDQVMISTVIGQLALNDSKETGIGYLFRGNDITGRVVVASPVCRLFRSIKRKDDMSIEATSIGLGLTSVRPPRLRNCWRSQHLRQSTPVQRRFHRAVTPEHFHV